MTVLSFAFHTRRGGEVLKHMLFPLPGTPGRRQKEHRCF